MKGLLTADFRRILKDKLLLVMGILALVFAATTPLIYALLLSTAGIEDIGMISGFISAKGQFFGSFSIGNNLGLIAPVLLAIALCKDFSFGTIRNKIIAGKSRTAIYLSLFITCATVLLAVMLLQGFGTLGISLLFFDYQPGGFTAADLRYFLESLAFEILVILWVASLLSFLCANMKNVGLVIVLYIAATFLLVIAASITQMALPILEFTDNSQALTDVVRFLDKINIGGAATRIGAGTAYTTADVLYLTLPPLTGIAGFTALGLWRFGKKDLK